MGLNAIVQRRMPGLAPILGSCLALLACPPRPPLDLGRDGEAHSPEELLRRVDLAESLVAGLKGEGKLAIDAPQGKGRVSIFVAAQEPARLHFEQLDFFGKPQGVLITDDGRFVLYLAEEGRAYRGPATAANLARFLPVAMPPEELTGLLLGRVPRIAAEAMELRLDREQGHYLLTLRAGPLTQVLQVAPPSHRVIHSAVTGAPGYELALSELTAYGGATLPKRIALTAAQAHTQLELTYQDLAVNPPPEEGLFEPVPPEGVPVIEVDAKGVPREAQPP